jgi:membrane protease YdiL (CAAX protease family)
MTSHFKSSRLIAITLLAIAMFSPMFVLHGLGRFDFWWWMSTNLITLISLSLFIDPSYRQFLKADFSSDVIRKVLFGLASAILLYFFFFAGNKLSRLLFDFAGQGISDVYAFKGDAEGIRIGILMLLVIGPGEEFFWRGFLQRHFQDRLGKWRGFILGTIIYTGVHVLTGNVMLIVAALVAGLFWGWMYMKYNSMVMNIVSHTIWDIFVFLILPFH